MTPSRKRSLATLPFGFLLSVAATLTATSGFAVAAADEVAGSPHDHASHVHEQHASPQQDHANHAHDQHGAQDAGDDPHAHHRAMMDKKGYKRSEQQYKLEDVRLTAMEGTETSLLAELDVGKPVMVNFIFTTCTTICPVMSATFAQVQGQLGPEVEDVRMVSISIDPEYDTPARLRTYANLFQAGDQWRFLTGDLEDIVAVQKAFDVYRGNKMNHEPTTLMRRAPGDAWVRLDGIASASEIVAEYHRLVAE